MIGLAAMSGADSPLDFFPGEAGRWILHEVCFTPVEFFLLPIVDWHGFRRRRKVIPQILHQLELLGWAEVEDGIRVLGHGISPLRHKHELIAV
jgi:hypothetical protein